MLAYLGDPAIKAKYLARVAAHRAADELGQGYGYWHNGKGCAVGCTIHSRNHADYEDEICPQVLGYLEEAIFEELPPDRALAWPERFLEAIQPGQDLSRVGWQLLHWFLTDETVNPGITHPTVADVVAQCARVIEPLTRGEPADLAEAREAANAAKSAAASAACEASMLRDASMGARYAAASVVCKTESAVNVAVAVWIAAHNAAWERIADKLIALIEEAPFSGQA